MADTYDAAYSRRYAATKSGEAARAKARAAYRARRLLQTEKSGRISRWDTTEIQKQLLIR